MTQTQTVDRDIAAIRAMMAATDTGPDAAPENRAATVRADVPPAWVKAPRGATTPKCSLVRAALARIRAYRPDSRTILRTSSILLLLLQPVLVLSLALITVLGLTITVLVVGTDSFWRGVLSVLDFCAKWAPRAARALRIRCLLVLRKWDLMLDRLPGTWGDGLRAPDLRALARADARHDDAMALRLSRLRDEAT